MFVITADQVDSRHRPDLAGAELDRIAARHGERLTLPPGRNAGDEIQMLTDDATTALHLVFELTRDDDWSVGLGCGAVRTPLPPDIREASGDAFFTARVAVERAKKARPRFAMEAAGADASHAEALIALTLLLRERRTEPGWEVYDHMLAGATQAEIAQQLGVSAPAVSSRAKHANIKAELEALPALARLIADVDASATGGAA
ncbi:DNA-binding protein [Agromyces aerolatus]|uniref:DNA-binding protein n=1 Tax=Agromyces sp. LY-1074 TaxID=3074080 RepID=UPI00285E5AC1|nr:MULTISPECIES: DNA-binding protein [unclassified Agromyces]MDR5700979.1 DNA-binding protein [Agromyces sp. LY-1074]MDR5707619.1 DNA-binding protein [Agromyces sp. LY-1358]